MSERSKSPKVSVISISYNQEGFIAQTLESFLMQVTDFEVEIIIADDCSTDNTAKIIDSYAKKHPSRIKPVLRPKNVGVQANLIDALARARGEYVALCEGDDFWTDPNKLQTQVDFLDANKDYSMCFHPVEVFFEDDPERKKISPSLKGSSTIHIDELLSGNMIPTNSVLYRRAEDYPSLDHAVMPLDWYLHLYHAKAGKIKFINKVMAKNRRHKQGVWWEAEKDQALTWVRYRNGWAHLFEVSLQMYGANKSSRERIQENIHTLLGVLLRRATPDDFKQFAAMITKELPGVAAVYAAWSIDELLRLKNKVEELADHSNKQGEIITHQGEAIQNESQKMSKIDAELKAIKSTRIWRYRTLVREKMGYNK